MFGLVGEADHLSAGVQGAGECSLKLIAEAYGWIPGHIRALARLPRLIEAEAEVSYALFRRPSALECTQKQLILLAMAGANDNRYTAAMHCEQLCSLGMPGDQVRKILYDYRNAGLSMIDTALLDFALTLGRHPTWITAADLDELRARGLGDAHLLETVVTTSLGAYLNTLAAGLGVEPDSEPPALEPASTRLTAFRRPRSRQRGELTGPFIRDVNPETESFPPLVRLKQRWGFIPNLFRAQMARPDLVEAQIRAIRTWLLTDDVLSIRQKECLFLAVSATNRNTYCVVAHCEILRGLGVPEEESEQIAIDHHQARLSETDTALLDAGLKLARRPAEFSSGDRESLRRQGFSEAQILEAVVIVAIANLINTLNAGLGVEPDFQSPVKELISPDRSPELLPAELPVLSTPEEDPDAECVARVQNGDEAAFEELVRRHGRRVTRLLSGILRRPEDVEDATQDTFVKAFQHIGDFQGRARFTTWLSRIAVNTGLQRLRRDKDFESLDENPATLETFRPRNVQPWQDDPEQSFSRSQVRQLVLDALMKLPLRYRLVLMLRDLQQLSTAETAEALGLGVPAVKSRLLRGRLMLRDSLSPHFSRSRTMRAHGHLRGISN